MSRPLLMTYRLALAISFDAAESRRRTAFRKTWNAADHACAARAFRKCGPLMELPERARYDETWIQP